MTGQVGFPQPCVVLCPPLDPKDPVPDWFPDCQAALIAQTFDVLLPAKPAGAGDPDSIVAPQPTAWVAAVTSAIGRIPAGTPLLIVAVGPTVSALPALAVAQRAARRGVIGYVLVDTDAAGSSGDWPGAPVTYVRTSAAPELGARLARLHGWQVIVGDPVTAVLAAAGRAVGAH